MAGYNGKNFFYETQYHHSNKSGKQGHNALEIWKAMSYFSYEHLLQTVLHLLIIQTADTLLCIFQNFVLKRNKNTLKNFEIIDFRLVDYDLSV